MTARSLGPDWLIVVRFLAALPARALAWILVMIGFVFMTLAQVATAISELIEGT